MYKDFKQYLICTAKSFEHIEMLIYNLQERIKVLTQIGFIYNL